MYEDTNRDPFEPPDQPTTPTAPTTPAKDPLKFYAGYKPMDAWNSFLQDQYGAKQSARGAGFYSGGNQYLGNLQGTVDAFNKNTGKQARVVSGDKIDFGQGAMDVITSDGDWWYSGGANGAQANGGQNVNGTNSGAAGTGSGGPSGGPAGVSAELYRMLLERAHQGTQINPNDPNIQQQVTPYAAQIERQRRNYLADAAEGSGANANLTGEARLASEHAGQATGLFQGQLVGRELDNRRTEIQNALSQLGSQLTADQQQALQRELAIMNDATSRYGISTNYDLGKSKAGLDNDYFNWETNPANPKNRK